MRRQRVLSQRNLVVAVLVVLVVNAQLTWWIVFSLRENRNRLRLDRERLDTSCRATVQRIDAELDGAYKAVVAAIAGGASPRHDAPPVPFEGWRDQPLDGCSGEWAREEATLMLTVAAASSCVVAVADPVWVESLLSVDAGFEIVGLGSEPSGIPQVAMLQPFEDRAVRPLPAAWEEILSGYRGRIIMMVSEGTFFAVLLFVLIALLARTLQRDLELERQHRNFLSAITHELKSPLAAIRLAIETVVRGRADASTGNRFLNNALSDVGRLQDLVQKVLEVTRYGGRSLALDRGCLSEVVDGVVGDFQGRADASGARLEAEVTDNVWMDLDEQGMAIVVSNLLENAVKYGGDEPRIGLELALDNGRAVLDVADSGPGISDDELPLVFNRFYRGGDEMTRVTRGTGLGLYLVQQIVKAHGGTVAVHATGPTGTTVRVMLPNAERKEPRS